MIETMGEPLASSAGVNETSNKNNSSSTLGKRKSRLAPQPPSSVARNHSHPVELLLSELAIRTPHQVGHRHRQDGGHPMVTQTPKSPASRRLLRGPGGWSNFLIKFGNHHTW
jgi:hypothetical protein